MESAVAEARQQLVVAGQEIARVLHSGRDLEIRGERAARRAALQLRGRARGLETQQRELETAAHDRARGQKAGPRPAAGRGPSRESGEANERTRQAHRRREPAGGRRLRRVAPLPFRRIGRGAAQPGPGVSPRGDQHEQRHRRQQRRPGTSHYKWRIALAIVK